MNSIDVLMLGWEFPPHNSGGLGTACESLTKALAAKNVNITFVLPKHVPIEAKHMRFCFADKVANVKVRTIDSPLTPYITASGYLKLDRSSAYGGNLFDEVRRYALLAREIAEEENFDIIHAHEWLSLGAGAVIKEETGKPFIAHMHSNEYHRSGGGYGHPLVHKLEEEGMAAADRVVAVSQHTKDAIVNHFNIPESKVEVIHNGMEIPSDRGVGTKWVDDVFSRLKADGKKIVLYVGRITLHKGADYFLRAAARVLSVADDVVFIVAGSGEMEYDIIKMASDLGVSDKVLFPGFLRGEALDRAYAMSDLFILPSVTEPFGLTPLESLMRDTPVMISKQSGVAEVLHHALKVDFWDVEEMANKILAVTNHQVLGKELALNGKQETFGITWDKAADKVVNLYNRMLKTQPA